MAARGDCGLRCSAACARSCASSALSVGRQQAQQQEGPAAAGCRMQQQPACWPRGHAQAGVATTSRAAGRWAGCSLLVACARRTCCCPRCAAPAVALGGNAMPQTVSSHIAARTHGHSLVLWLLCPQIHLFALNVLQAGHYHWAAKRGQVCAVQQASEAQGCTGELRWGRSEAELLVAGDEHDRG